jgi:hypothetical protein
MRKDPVKIYKKRARLSSRALNYTNSRILELMSSNITREQLAAEKPIVNTNLLVRAANAVISLS